MKKLVTRATECLFVLLLAAALLVPRNVFAQAPNHVVSSAQLRQDIVSASATRQQNITQIEDFLATPGARQALASQHIAFRQVKEAVPQLNNQDLARLSKMSQKAQKDFAAGDLSNRDLLWILVAVAALILIIVAVR
jgi:Flp pilus assembly protein TadB